MEASQIEFCFCEFPTLTSAGNSLTSRIDAKSTSKVSKTWGDAPRFCLSARNDFI